MLDKAKILLALQDGETMDEILDDLSYQLNAIKDEFEEVEAKRKEEEKALAAKRAEEDRIYNAKREAVYVMLSGLSDFLIAAGEEELQKEIGNMDIDVMVRTVDNAVGIAKRVEALNNIEFADGLPWDGAFGFKN